MVTPLGVNTHKSISILHRAPTKYELTALVSAHQHAVTSFMSFGLPSYEGARVPCSNVNYPSSLEETYIRSFSSTKNLIVINFYPQIPQALKT